MRSKDFIILLFRLGLGYIFLSSGFNKLTFGIFGHLIGPPNLISDLIPYQLEKFGYFIAISQVLIGVLTLSQRFSIIGLIAMLPMNTCILAITYSQNWGGTPIVNLLLLLLNIICLVYEWDSLKFLVISDISALLKIPKTTVQFPDLKLPIFIILVFSGAIVMAILKFSFLKYLACLGYTLVFYNIIKQHAFRTIDKLILAIMYFAIVLITFGKELFKLGINPFYAIAIFFFLGLVLLLVSVFFRKK